MVERRRRDSQRGDEFQLVSDSGLSSRLEVLRAYAGPFSAYSAPIAELFPHGNLSLFPFEPDSDRGLAVLLLYAALVRPGGEERAAAVLGGLYRKLGDDLFRLNRIPFPVLQAALSEPAHWPDPEEKKRVPGILRSACDFLCIHGSLVKWLSGSQDWESCVHVLSQEIFWMGRHSRLQTKARYFLWLCSSHSGFGSRIPAVKNFAWPLSAGHERFFRNILRPGVKRKAHVAGFFPTLESKLLWFGKLAQSVFPEEGWKLFVPLQAYLQPENRMNFVCRRIQGGCRRCALGSICPESKNLDPA